MGEQLLTGGASAMIAALVTWIFTRKKNHAEIVKIEVDTVAEVARIWRELSDELQEQLKELKGKYDDLHKEVKGLRSENNQLKKQINNL